MVASVVPAENKEPRRPGRPKLAVDLGFSVALGVVAAVALATLFARPLSDPGLPLRTLVLAVFGGGLVLLLAARHLETPRFGVANRLTLARGALAIFLVALLGAPPSAAGASAAIGAGVLALLLDHLDGRIARRRAETSAFGARFDMETDALLILALAALAWQLGKAGPWVLLAGGLRYGFVAAAWVWPWLAAPLPPSRRRQAVCVVQVVTLLVVLLPPVGRPWSALVALAGLSALGASFAIDVRLLARRAAPSVRWPALRAWLVPLAALWLLNAAFTLHNVWPTIGVTTRHELSIDLAVLVLALFLMSALWRAPRRAAIAVLTALALMLGIGRYAEITAPALYGRPVNLYFDAQYLPNVAAMLAEVVPAWLLAAAALGLCAAVALLVAMFYFTVRALGVALALPAQRRALGALAAGVVALYVMSHAFDWRTRFWFAIPVTPTFMEQAGFVYAALGGRADRVLPNAPLADSDLGAIAGSDVIVAFLESYGAVAYDDPEITSVVAPARARLAAAAAASGRYVVSAFVESPTFGGGSWLAHSSFMTGATIRDQGGYELLLTQRRETLAKRFSAHGYRTVMWMPGLRNAWPEGAFYGFDTIAGAPAIAYRGPDFGWWRIPDQYVLAKLDATERRRDGGPPVFAFIATINTHIPFRPTPPVQSDWQRLLSDDPFDAEAVAAATAERPEWHDLGRSYAATLAYTFEYWAAYVSAGRDDDSVLVLLGDHQPQASVTGPGARWDVPVHVITSREDLAARLIAAGFVQGLAFERDAAKLDRVTAEDRAPEAEIEMAELTTVLLEAFDSSALSAP